MRSGLPKPMASRAAADRSLCFRFQNQLLPAMTVGTLTPSQDKPALPSIAFVMSVAGLFHHLVLSCPKVTVSGKGRAGKHSFSYVQNCRLVPDLCSLSCLHRLESASPEMTKTRPCWRPAQAKTDWRKIGHPTHLMENPGFPDVGPLIV